MLGIDTSCYTTSCALVDTEGNILRDIRKILPVPEGQCGFRQSTALFHHVQQLPLCMAELMRDMDIDLQGICVSIRPRDVEGSYMPVFLSGQAVASSIAEVNHLPLILTSHQRGHIYAALAGRKHPASFYCLHLSGGTTETLRITGDDIDIIGQGSDVQAGQLVDRVGTALGLPFPCGPHLEELAVNGQSRSIFPAAVKNHVMSFSGAETQALRLVGKLPPEDIARELYSVISRSIAKVVAGLPDDQETVLMGGVASSALLREMLTRQLEKKRAKNPIYFAPSQLSSDNAVGVALYGLEQMKGGC